MKKKKPQNKARNKHICSTITDDFLTDAINLLIQKRIGGSVNIKGIGFQLLYSIQLILKYLNSKEPNWVRLEGIEDVDLHSQNSETYFQIKTSQNAIDASQMWSLNVFQNFYEVFKLNPESHFVLVHNTTLAKGNLEVVRNNPISPKILEFWQNKFNESGVKITNDELSQFFKRISIEKTSESILLEEIKRSLIEKFNTENQVEQVFIRALFFHVFDWAKSKATVTFEGLSKLMQLITDSFSKFPINLAIQNNLIERVSFDVYNNESDTSYFDGKAARPIDIAMRRPVKRELLESTIIEEIRNFDITVIKSSSGQGKSTLAWQVSQSLVSKGFTIYQLNNCPDWTEVASISDFLIARVNIGEVPVVVVDGLNNSLSAWGLLAEKLKDNPVKIIITTREEDWIRYGMEVTNLTLKIIDIKLTETEAKKIFSELQINKRIHAEIAEWQPAWEKVKERGLLIEFVYLLTRGEMLSARLSGQVKKLNSETSSGIKLEILRLVAIADVLNVKLRTIEVSAYLKAHFLGETDQNEIYRQLEKEYYLNFSKSYIQGLHPVRSRHLIDILLSHTPADESLLVILELIEEDNIYEYFINLQLQFPDLKNEYFQKAAKIMAKRKPSEMVYALDGLMHFEPYKYWTKNIAIYNKVNEAAGLDLFIYSSIPFIKHNVIESFSSALSNTFENSNLKFLRNQLSLLSKYDTENGEIKIFLKSLSQELSSKKQIKSSEGVGFLYKWFKCLDVPFPNIFLVTEADLLRYLKSKHVDETGEIFNFFHITHPDRFKLFIDEHKADIIAYLKKRTNSLIIEEIGDDIHIQYLLDHNVDQVNEMSVYRINTVFSFLPFYKHYCTSLIVLPFPNEGMYKVITMNASKAIPVENMHDTFDIHINQIWTKVLFDRYSYSSVYEWQKEFITLREFTITLMKKVVYLFEAYIEKNSKSITRNIKEVTSVASEFLVKQDQIKKYPSVSNKYFEKNSISEHQKPLNNWGMSFRNFITQMSGILSPTKVDDSRLPIANLNDALYQLPKMQKSFELIVANTSCYFEVEAISRDELCWMNRLHQTVNYYVNNPSEKAIACRVTIEKWWVNHNAVELSQLYNIVNSFEAETKYKFLLPKKIIVEGNLKHCTIGVSNFDISNDADLWSLSIGLCDLGDTGFHFFVFIIVDSNKEVTGAIRMSDNYFKKFQDFLKYEDFENDDWNMPLPVIPDSEMIATLEGVKLKALNKDPKNEAYFTMMINCWKLSEYRARLNTINKIEKDWLMEIEEEYQNLIFSDFDKVYVPENSNVKPTKEYVARFIEAKDILTKEEIVEYMLEKAIVLSATAE